MREREREREKLAETERREKKSGREREFFSIHSTIYHHFAFLFLENNLYNFMCQNCYSMIIIINDYHTFSFIYIFDIIAIFIFYFIRFYFLFFSFFSCY